MWNWPIFDNLAGSCGCAQLGGLNYQLESTEYKLIHVALYRFEAFVHVTNRLLKLVVCEHIGSIGNDYTRSL